jgi:hypothetical protein
VIPLQPKLRLLSLPSSLKEVVIMHTFFMTYDVTIILSSDTRT